MRRSRARRGAATHARRHERARRIPSTFRELLQDLVRLSKEVANELLLLQQRLTGIDITCELLKLVDALLEFGCARVTGLVHAGDSIGCRGKGVLDQLSVPRRL